MHYKCEFYGCNDNLGNENVQYRLRWYSKRPKSCLVLRTSDIFIFEYKFTFFFLLFMEAIWTTFTVVCYLGRGFIHFLRMIRGVTQKPLSKYKCLGKNDLLGGKKDFRKSHLIIAHRNNNICQKFYFYSALNSKKTRYR